MELTSAYARPPAHPHSDSRQWLGAGQGDKGMVGQVSPVGRSPDRGDLTGGLSSVLSTRSRLELNGIKSIPPGAFSPYRKLRRM